MYTRQTELREIRQDDLSTLFTLLEDNDFWKKLTTIIPSNGCDWQKLAADGGRHFDHFHVSLLECAINKLHGMDLSELGEGVTLGILLDLLVTEELYQGMYAAVDFVANYLLNETSPARPSNGPAAIIDIRAWDEPQHQRIRWNSTDSEPLYEYNGLEQLLEEQKDNIQMVSADNSCIV